MERDNTADPSWQCELPTYSDGSEIPPSIDGLLRRMRPEAGPPVCGIQGGRGSFNEQVLNHYIASHTIIDFNVSYPYAMANVLAALNHGAVDFGLFALRNKYG